MKKNHKKVDSFSKWLLRRGMTREQFALATGVPYNTAAKWNARRKPKRFAMEAVMSRFPDCPLDGGDREKRANLARIQTQGEETE